MGHPGIPRLTAYLRESTEFAVDDLLRETIRSVCQNCAACAQIKPRFYKPPRTKLIHSTRPLERLSIDLKGPIVGTHPYLLTIIDEYSRFPFGFALQGATTDEIIASLEALFNLFGTPESMHSDRGTQFTSNAFRAYLEKQKIGQTFTTPYNPQGNGQCERMNQTLWRTIQLRLSDSGSVDWSSELPRALDNIRSLVCKNATSFVLRQ